jgi:NADH dehydrogenase
MTVMASHRDHETPKVVILGGGFGGLYCATNLGRAAVALTVVDRRNFHLFQPLLYQVATGSLSPGEIAAPLRAVLRRQRNTSVLLSEAVDLDVSGRRLILSDGELPYDTLVVATGAVDSYFGHPEWKRYAPGLKSVEDATEMRRRIYSAFEAAEKETNPERRRELLTFVVVGGGPTGVELAGALGEIANDTFRGDFRSIRPEESRILLVDASSRVLPPYPPELSAKAEHTLIRHGERTMNNLMVTDIDGEGVTVRRANGATHRIATRTVLWAAGVQPSPVGKLLGERAGATLERGRVVVGPDLSIPGHPEIFVIGDLAHAAGADGKPLPGVAPVAMQQGRYVAKTIVRRIRGEQVPPFRYRNKGNLAVIGRTSAVADFGFLHLSGWVAWLIWLFVHLMYLVGFQNRVLVFVQWGLRYLTFHRGARLITGADGPTDSRTPEPAPQQKTQQVS